MENCRKVLSSSFGLQRDQAGAAGMGRSALCVLGGQGSLLQSTKVPSIVCRHKYHPHGLAL